MLKIFLKMTSMIAPFSVVSCIHWSSDVWLYLILIRVSIKIEAYGASPKSANRVPWARYFFFLPTLFIVDGYDDAYQAKLIWRSNELRYAEGLAGDLAQGQWP